MKITEKIREAEIVELKTLKYGSVFRIIHYDCDMDFTEKYYIKADVLTNSRNCCVCVQLDNGSYIEMPVDHKVVEVKANLIIEK